MAKQARYYGVTLGYKATAMPWYGPGGIIGPFHHGIDYGAPKGSTVVLSGQTIGLSGNTGATSGPHLHVDRRPIGSSVSNRYAFKPPGKWWQIQGKVVKAGYSGTAGNVIAIQYEGDEYRFLHLSKINVKVGDIVGDMYKSKTAKQWYEEYRKQQKRAEYYKKKSNTRGGIIDRIRAALPSNWFKK